MLPFSMECLEVTYNVLAPFLTRYKNDMRMAQETLSQELLFSKPIESGEGMFFRNEHTYYHASGTKPYRIDWFGVGDIHGRKLHSKAREVTFPRSDRVVALALESPPYYRTRYFCDNADNSFYTLEDVRGRLILKRRELGNSEILKVDLKRDFFYHIGIEVKDVVADGELTMGRDSVTRLYNFTIENTFGVIPETQSNILLEMLNALVVFENVVGSSTVLPSMRAIPSGSPNP